MGFIIVFNGFPGLVRQLAGCIASSHKNFPIGGMTNILRGRVPPDLIAAMHAP